MDGDHETNRRWRKLRWGVLAAALVFGIWAIFGFAPYSFTGDWEEAGLIGDSFGFVNALISALAFAGVIYAIRLQSQELELQREELRETRKELARTAEAQVKSEQALQRQAELTLMGVHLNALVALRGSYAELATSDEINEDLQFLHEQLEMFVAQISAQAPLSVAVDDQKGGESLLAMQERRVVDRMTRMKRLAEQASNAAISASMVELQKQLQVIRKGISDVHLMSVHDQVRESLKVDWLLIITRRLDELVSIEPIVANIDPLPHKELQWREFQKGVRDVATQIGMWPGFRVHEENVMDRLRTQS